MAGSGIVEPDFGSLGTAGGGSGDEPWVVVRRIGVAHVPLAHTVEVCARQSVCMSEHVFVGTAETAYRRCSRIPLRGRRRGQTDADGRA
jgi:hypothetical protein